MNDILGLAGQHAAAARLLPPDTDRTEFLDTIAAHWTLLDAEHYPFTLQVAAQLAEHDDRTQFLAGIDLILDGINHRNSEPHPRMTDQRPPATEQRS